MEKEFNIFSLGDRSTSGVSAGFLDKVLDGNVTLTDSSASETWAIFKRVHRLTKTKPKWRPYKGEMTWSLPCQLCLSKSFGANPDGRKLSRRPCSDTAGVLGQMYVDRDSATAAHNECMWYAAGQDMIQFEDEDLEGKDHINRFKISSIQQCIHRHRNRKCAFCNVKGACTECANPRCRGKKGWYHLPCGFKNGTVQMNDKSFCGEKHALKERRSLEVTAEKRKKLIIASLERGISQPVGARRNEMARKVPPKKSDSSSSDQLSNTDTQKRFSRKPSFEFIKVRKLIPFGSNVDEPSIYLDIAEMQDQDTMEDTVTDQSGDELSLSHNLSTPAVDAIVTLSNNVDRSIGEETVDLEEDLLLSQSRPESPTSDGVQLESEKIVQEEPVNRSQDSIDVDLNGVNTSLDTMISEIEPFDSSMSSEQMKGPGIADRSFNELVSAGSAGKLLRLTHHQVNSSLDCTISELACGSGEGRVVIKSDAFTDLDEKDASTGQEVQSRDSSVTLRTSLNEFHSFGEQESTNPCDDCEIMKDQVKQIKHKFHGAVYWVDHYKKQNKLRKEEIDHLSKKSRILKQQKTDVVMKAEEFQSASQSLEMKLGEMETKMKNLQRDNHTLKKEKDEKDKLIEGLTKANQDQAKVCEEQSQLIEDQRNKIIDISHSLAKAEEEKTNLKKKMKQERNKAFDKVIEFVEKQKRNEASCSTRVENGGDDRKCYARKRTSQDPESATKRKRLDKDIDIKEA